ncbi:hypothetical protein KUTeg_003128 [Tegillarca granosa]|uniref:Chitinase n=1 Tax=Tegillarca granosa TaxID=220873 RepID=A0ABQ9FL83_TEGGR|nr:hypothetical protein KUTeg_003128 [Tegillarca granosa]
MIKNGATRHWLDGAEVPYLVQRDQWVGYDDPESLRKKVDFVKQNGFGGIMVWALTLDDFSNTCGEASHHHTLELSSQFDCRNKASGYYADPSDCSKYFLCAANMAFKGKCAQGLVFDIDTEYCEIDTKGKCLSNATPMPSTTNMPLSTGSSSSMPSVTMALLSNSPITMAPTTKAQTTVAPKTANPTTAARTTTAPTTANPTTKAQTTIAQTTAAAAPTTQVPTTVAQTTTAPTTANPTTKAQTTAAPTTANPTTKAPTTLAQTTTAPTTASPTTQVPTTAAPTTTTTMAPIKTTKVPVTTPAPTTAMVTQQKIQTSAASVIDPATFCVNKADGIHTDPTNCQHYYECAVGLSFQHSCGVGTAFNPVLHICDYPQHVPHCSALRRVCYYTNWAQYRNGIGKFKPENVDPFICTHINYAFATLNGNKLKAFEWNDESTPWMKGMYERFQALKRMNPSLKTLLAVGGWNLASGPFHRMVATDSSRREFATTSITFLRKNGFDGIDLDWEYPTLRGGGPDDRHKYTLLCKVLREEFEKEAQRTGKPRLIVSAAVAAGKDKIDVSYEIPEISRSVYFYDYLLLEAQDLFFFEKCIVNFMRLSFRLQMIDIF